MSRIERVKPARREGWCFGLQLGAYAWWVAGTALGAAFVGGLQHWPAVVRDALAFVLPALFCALLLESKPGQHRATIAAAGVAAVALATFLPSYHALALAILVGALCHAVGKR